MAAEEAHLGDATATASPKLKNPAVDGVAMAAPAGGHGRGPGNKLSLVPLIFLIFFEVAGGPYGAEPAVQSAGPLFALLGFLIFPFIWAVPESLVTAELSTAMPGNGGFVLWADRAFGSFSGSLMGTWKYVSGAINGAAFPALCADYVARVAPAVSGGGSRVATIVAFNVAISVLNYTGLSIVGWTAVALGVASLSPFALMFGAALPKIRPHRWRATAVDKDWKLFFNTLFWNLNYWDSASTMAGEVERPGKTFPRALLSAVAMTTLGYLLPLMAATGAIDAAPEDWGNGFFADAAGMIAGRWLKYWIEVGAVLSTIGLYSATPAWRTWASSPGPSPTARRCSTRPGSASSPPPPSPSPCPSPASTPSSPRQTSSTASACCSSSPPSSASAPAAPTCPGPTPCRSGESRPPSRSASSPRCSSSSSWPSPAGRCTPSAPSSPPPAWRSTTSWASARPKGGSSSATPSTTATATR